MANNHYACYAFPQRVYDRYQEEIEAIFEEYGGQDVDTFEEGGVIRFSCPVCSDSESIDNVLISIESPWGQDPFFSVYVIFSDGIDFEDHQTVQVGRKAVQVNGNDPEHPQVSFTLDHNSRLNTEKNARLWARAYAAFRYYCGKGRVLSKEHRHAAGGRSDSCPNCHSSDVDGEGVDVQGDRAVQECTCCDCGCSWENVYMLIGARILADAVDE